jgi:hypothetical protein
VIFPAPHVQAPDGTFVALLSRIYGVFDVLQLNPGKDGGPHRSSDDHATLRTLALEPPALAAGGTNILVWLSYPGW